MQTTDLIQLIIASAFCGAATVVVILLVWTFIRDARADRERRENYIQGRTIRPHLHL